MELPSNPDDDAAPLRHLRARLRFKHLDLLVRLGDSTSLHQASASMAMTQSAATKLLQEVELMVGAQLFERSRTGITPTAAGTAMVARARVQLNLLQAMHAEVRAIERGATGQVRIGVSANAASDFLIRALTLLQASAPGVVVSAYERGPEMLDELRHGEFDCVVGRLPMHSEGPDLHWERLYDEAVCIVVRSNHPLLKCKDKLRWPDALAYDWIMPPEEGAVYKALYTWFQRQSLPPPRSHFHSVSLQANIALVQDSDSVALLPAGVSKRLHKQKQLDILALKLPIKLPSVALIRRSGEAPSAATQSLIEALRTAAIAERSRTGKSAH